MTRARYHALAVLLAGMCGLAHTPAFAQTGPAAPGYGAPQPMGGPAWYGTADEVESAPGPLLGPIIHSDGGFLRLEYMNYTIAKPGDTLLGAPVAGVPDPTKPFPVFAPGSAQPIAMATVPTTNGMNLGGMNGIQATAGISLIDEGSVEVSGFFFGTKETGYLINHFGISSFQTSAGPPPVVVQLPDVIATSLFFQGQLSDHLLLYNKSFKATFQSQLWGAEANYFYDQDADGLLQFRPLIGGRYLNLTERLNQTGVFRDFVLGGPDIVSTIDSHTVNNLYGGQFGFRLGMVTKFIEIGVTPKALFMGNTVVADVTTNHLRSNFDPVVSSPSSGKNVTSTFSLGGEVVSHVQLNLTPRFCLRGGYNVLWLNRVTRPQNNVFYNDNGTTAAPAVVEKISFHDVLISGFTVGAELRF